MKACTKCKIEKESEEFYGRKAGGLHSWCKLCQKMYNKTPEYKLYLKKYDKDRQQTEERKKYNRTRAKTEKSKKTQAKYENERRKNDPLYKLSRCLRVRINTVLKRNGFSKKSSLNQYLGCTFEEFKFHIENNFIEGMSWNNHGFGSDKWNFDHTIPLSSAKTVEKLYELCHFANIKPMWQLENFKKGNRQNGS